MSAEAVLLPEHTRPERRRSLRPLEAPAPRRRPKLVYAVIALGGAALIALAQIGLTIATTQDSFVLKDLTSQNRALTLEAQALEDTLAGVSSPQALATKASELGMVVAGSASYLRLSDGAVAGAGSDAGWVSSVNPAGSGAVANALLDAKVPAAPAQETAAETPASDLPATLEQGLPTPSTH
ncbi:hypothetical protein ACWGJP_09765 [Microbacterium sp. NPDC055903]